MANEFYNFTTPVVSGATIRADKYNSDQQSIETAFGDVSESLAKAIQLPSTFTGNSVMPEQTVNNTFIYVNANGDIALYPVATFVSQIADVASQHADVAGWHQDVELNSFNAAQSEENANTYAQSASGFADDAQGFAQQANDAKSLSQEYANSLEDVFVTGTSDYSAFHWSKKAEQYANDTLAVVEGDFVPTSRTINGQALSANITLSAANVGAVPTARTVNGKALDADITLTTGDVGAVPTTRTVNGKALSSDIALVASDVGVDTSKIPVSPLEAIALASGVVDLSQGTVFSQTLVTDTTYTVTNVQSSPAVNSFILELTNGGAHLVSFNFTLTWSSGIAPTLTVSGKDILGFYTTDGGTTWHGLVLSIDAK